MRTHTHPIETSRQGQERGTSAGNARLRLVCGVEEEMEITAEAALIDTRTQNERYAGFETLESIWTLKGTQKVDDCIVCGRVMK